MKKLMVVALFAAGAANAETMALYTFEGGTEGEAPTTLVNKVNPGTYDASVHSVDKDGVGVGTAPFWTNTVPGNCVFSDASCETIISRNPQALKLTSAAEASSGSSSDFSTGGIVELLGLADALRTKDRYTVEWFWRPDAHYDWARIMSVPTGSQAPQVCDYPGSGAAIMMSLDYNHQKGGPYDTKNGYDNCSIANQGWQHWAITVDQSTKTLALYYRGVLIQTLTTTTSPGGTGYANVLFGGWRGWNGTDTAFGRLHRGEISCIRVSDELLEPSQFMRLGAGAFYAFKDAATGTTVETVTNSFTTDFTGTPTAVASSENGSKPGTLPRFSKERPGKYVWSSSKRETLLCEDPQSVQFRSDDYWDTPRGSVDFANLGGCINMMLDEFSEFTIECFYRHDWGHIGVTSGTLATFDVCDNHNGSIPLFHGSWQNLGLKYYVKNHDDCVASVENYGEGTREDGLWHHAAFVCRKVSDGNKRVVLYVDYARDAQATDSPFRYTTTKYAQRPYARSRSDAMLRLGRPLEIDNPAHPYVCFNGYVSCYRVVPAALTPDQFMVVTNGKDAPADGTAFNWRFEESAKDSAIATAADSVGNEKWSVGKVLSAGDDVVAPTVSGDHLGYRLTNDLARVKNQQSATFAAQSEGAVQSLQTREWYGLPVLHPASWTMEAFVKPGAAPASDALIVGRGRLNPSSSVDWYDWALVLQPNGKLGLKGSREDPDTAGATLAYAFADIGDSLADGAWHQVAVTYDGEEKTFGVWVDGVCRRTETLGSAQVDNLFGRYMVAQGCGQSSYAGGLDEVRLVGHVLTEDEMTRVYHSGLGLLLLLQ